MRARDAATDGRGNDYNRAMTDTTPASDPAVPGQPAPAPVSATPASSRADGRSAGRGLSATATALVVVVLLAAALVAALWIQRQQFQRTGREVALRLDEVTAALDQARTDARQSLALAQAQAGRLSALEDALDESRSQYAALEQAWQNFNAGTGDSVLLNDIDRLVTMASQQLRLAGNVSNAIVALETAQSRLAQADRPRFASLQQAINGDLDRLRAVPLVDIPVQAARIERLVAEVGRLPLLVPDAAAPEVAAAPETAPMAPAEPDPAAGLPADAPWWVRWRAQVGSWPARVRNAVAYELSDLVRVQRVAEPGALLMSPEQGEQLRANLRQRLLTAQVALLMRQPSIWQAELDAVGTALETRYDTHLSETRAAVQLARNLARTSIAVALPDVSDSLSALAALRSAGDRTPRRGE